MVVAVSEMIHSADCDYSPTNTLFLPARDPIVIVAGNGVLQIENKIEMFIFRKLGENKMYA